MDSFELNKIIGAILGTLLFVMAVGFIAEGIYAPITDKGPGYSLPEPTAAAATVAAAAPVVPLADLLAKADPQQGQESAKKCQACHDFGENGPNKIGPDLYGVVGRPVASHAGFEYSDALKKFAGQSWTYELLNTWITSPSHMAPGTKMTFIGIDDPEERANVLAYLRTLSHNPVPFPAPGAPANAPGAAAPAAGSASGPASAAGSAPTPAATPTPAGTTPATAGATSTPSPAPTPAPGTTTTNTAPNATTAAPTTTAAPAASAPAATTPAPATPAAATPAPAAVPATTPAQ